MQSYIQKLYIQIIKILKFEKWGNKVKKYIRKKRYNRYIDL